MSTSQYCSARCTPTVYPAKSFDAHGDAAALKKAMKGIGSDGKAIIEIVCKRGVVQRLDISEAYKKDYGRDLVSDLKSELKGNLENVVVALMTPLPQYYARELHNAMAGVGTDEQAIIEILSTLSNYGLKTIASFYEQMYGKSLESDLVDDTSGSFKKLCVSLSMGSRDENPSVDDAEVEKDAKDLFDAGVGRWGTEESVFNRILVTRSYQHLKKVFNEYERLANHDIETAISKEFSGDIREGLLAVAKCVESKVGFFAERLYKSMKGVGTRDKTLIRIIVSRCEIDLGDIKKAFEAKYGKPLESWISGDTSGEYKKALLTLVGSG